MIPQNFEPEVKYTTDEYGITKAEFVVPCSDKSDYMFTYSIDSKINDDAERILYKVDVAEIPHSKLRRIFGQKKPLMTYTLKKCCDMSCRHIPPEERKKEKILEENLRGKHFDYDIKQNKFIPNHSISVAFDATKDDYNLNRTIVTLDEIYRGRIAEKAVKIKESKMTEEERLEAYHQRLERAAEEGRRIMQGHGRFPRSGHANQDSPFIPTHETAHAENLKAEGVECEAVQWRKGKVKIRKVKMPPVDPTLDPEMLKRAARQKARAEATEKTKAAFEKWLKENGKTPENH